MRLCISLILSSGYKFVERAIFYGIVFKLFFTLRASASAQAPESPISFLILEPGSNWKLALCNCGTSDQYGCQLDARHFMTQKPSTFQYPQNVSDYTVNSGY